MQLGNWSIALFLAIALLVCVGGLLLSRWLAPKQKSAIARRSGEAPLEDGRRRFPLRPYLAVLFLVVLEAGVVVLLAWGVVFRQALREGRWVLWEPLAFIGALAVGLIYVWRKGGFAWE